MPRCICHVKNVGSILTHKNRESIPLGRFGPWIVKMNPLFTIKSWFIYHVSWPYSKKVPLSFRVRTPFLLRLCLCRWTETQQFTRIHATKGALIEFGPNIEQKREANFPIFQRQSYIPNRASPLFSRLKSYVINILFLILTLEAKSLIDF